MRSRHFLFDLDGTLIDSAPAILECYRVVLEQFAIETKFPLENSLIGPPLASTLQLISGVTDEKITAEMTAVFKAHYDTTGIEQSIAYPGIDTLLHKLNVQNQKLYIITNKRIMAARKILDFMNWSDFFDGVYAQDAFNPSLPSKASVIEHTLDALHIPKIEAIYVGDRIEDGEAAQVNELKFVWVAWGYGDPYSHENTLINYEVAREPLDLERYAF